MTAGISMKTHTFGYPDGYANETEDLPRIREPSNGELVDKISLSSNVIHGRDAHQVKNKSLKDKGIVDPHKTRVD